MKTNVIKARFIRDCKAAGREYTYYTPETVKVGDLVDVETNHGTVQAQVSRVNVPTAEITQYGDKARSIIGKTACRCEDCALLIPCGEGDHICDANPVMMPLEGYARTGDYLWCKGCFFHRNGDASPEAEPVAPVQQGLFPPTNPGTPWDYM